jgi:hypothetical protein
MRRIKAEVQKRRCIVPLVDMLTEAVLRTGCLDAATSVSGGGSLAPKVLAERLLLVSYAYGTNTGIKAVPSGGHGLTEGELRYVRCRYLSAGPPAPSLPGSRTPPSSTNGTRSDRYLPEDFLRDESGSHAPSWWRTAATRPPL